MQCSLPCIPGTFQDTQASTQCKSCNVDTFSSSKSRKTPCETCPQGRTAAIGSTSCSSCAAGKRVTAAGLCLSCPSGYFSASTDSQSCDLCSLGKTTIAGMADCLGCDLGTFGSQPGICSNCPPGRYQDGKGEKNCYDCSIDTFLPDKGKSSKADCQQCPSERSTGSSKGNTNASACLCKRTEYYQDENSECLECPVGANCSAHDGIMLKNLTALPGYWRASAMTTIFTDCSLAFSSSMTPKKAAIKRCPGGETALETFNADTQCRTAYGGPCKFSSFFVRKVLLSELLYNAMNSFSLFLFFSSIFSSLFFSHTSFSHN